MPSPLSKLGPSCLGQVGAKRARDEAEGGQVEGTLGFTGCKQWFHKECILQWVSTKLEEETLLTCPLCRQFDTFLFSGKYDLVKDGPLTRTALSLPLIYAEDCMIGLVNRGANPTEPIAAEITVATLSSLARKYHLDLGYTGVDMLMNDLQVYHMATLWEKRAVARYDNQFAAVLRTREYGGLVAWAIRADDTAMLKWLHTEGVSFRNLDILNNHALHVAATHGAMEAYDLVHNVLHSELARNFTNVHGFDVLLSAVYHNQYDFVKMLLEELTPTEHGLYRMSLKKSIVYAASDTMEDPTLKLYHLLLSHAKHTVSEESLREIRPEVIRVAFGFKNERLGYDFLHKNNDFEDGFLFSLLCEGVSWHLRSLVRYLLYGRHSHQLIRFVARADTQQLVHDLVWNIGGSLLWSCEPEISFHGTYANFGYTKRKRQDGTGHLVDLFESMDVAICAKCNDDIHMLDKALRMDIRPLIQLKNLNLQDVVSMPQFTHFNVPELVLLFFACSEVKSLEYWPLLRLVNDVLHIVLYDLPDMSPNQHEYFKKRLIQPAALLLSKTTPS